MDSSSQQSDQSAPPKMVPLPARAYRSSTVSKNGNGSHTAAPAAKPIVNPELQVDDVKAHIIVILEDRHGDVFRRESNEVLQGILNPANRGHMARVLETQFKLMGELATNTFGLAYAKRDKESSEATKPAEKEPATTKASTEFRPTAPLTTYEALQKQALPPPPMPGAPTPLPPPAAGVN